MSLPPGFLDDLRDRASLSQVVGRKVMWDARKSNQGKGDMWAPCPFHHEKTASFHVDDKKGFYYCFGCHAKGDAISFIRETENVSFIEAVAVLAQEAGMEMPAQDPKAQEKSDHRTRLIEVMDMAVQFFRLQLNTGGGAAARNYLTGRGLEQKAVERWEIGFAPNGWQGLWDHLSNKGVEADLIFGAGLAKPSNKGGKPYDTFRNRIMFPIRDGRGRAIAFGGRAMDPNDNAKYLNSPETELFDKGRTLYNHASARTAAGKGQPLVVAEGYMDVIAMVEAGFEGAVAPLGTAITENQLALLWRIAPEPVIALDGDTAGTRAALRLIDLALPLLEAGQSLRFAMMPEGKDPDDLIRDEGAGALRALVGAARPMVQLLWQREVEGRDFDSPERKAALDKTLRDKIKTIRDPSIRSHYGQEIKDLRWQLFRRKSTPSKKIWNSKKPQDAPLAETKSSLLGGSDATEHLREAVILASLLATPQVIEEFETGIESMICADPVHGQLRDLILRHGHKPEALIENITTQMGAVALEKLNALRHVAISPCVRNPGNIEMAKMTLVEELAKLESSRGLSAEIAEAAEEVSGVGDEAMTWRLGKAAEARNKAVRSEHEDKAEYDTAKSGARIKRDERNALDALLEQIKFAKPGK